MINLSSLLIGEDIATPMEPVPLLGGLIRASRDGDLATVKHLLEELRIDPQSCRDEYERTPLDWAARNGHLDTVRYLVEERSCDVLCRDKYGDTSLNGAALRGKLDTVQYLISEQGCDPMCRGQYGRTLVS